MIAIVKYNAGNIGSVINALNRLGIENKVTDNPIDLITADKVIFPGVGEAGTAMKYLKERHLDKVIINLKQPVLGICLGMQLMCHHSEESDTRCMGIFNTNVKLFDSYIAIKQNKKVPHMGWNSIHTEYQNENIINFKTYNRQSLILKNLPQQSDAYYVHSFYAEICKNTVASCDYIVPFSSVLQKDNFYATQFHPEKSAEIGEQILKNFIEL